MFKSPQLVNTDNDSLLPQKIYFDLESVDSAFHSLKDLAEGVSEKDLLSEAELKNGLVEKAEIQWLGGTDEARKRLGGPVLLGTMALENHKLIVSVNSNRRAETIRRLIEERLGSEATYKTTLIEPIESEIEKLWQAAGTGSDSQPSSGTDVISLEDAPPEVRARLEETVRQHWTTWLDLPVPALNNQTPREATQTEEGRDLLGSLLLDFERRAEACDDFTRPDVAALRRALGMEV